MKDTSAVRNSHLHCAVNIPVLDCVYGAESTSRVLS